MSNINKTSRKVVIYQPGKINCTRCNKLEPREEVRWIRFVLSPYCSTVCKSCAEKYKRNIITRIFVKFER